LVRKQGSTLSPRLVLGVALLATFVGIVFVSLIGATTEARRADQRTKKGAALIDAATTAQIQAARTSNRGTGPHVVVAKARAAARVADVSPLGVAAGNELRAQAAAYAQSPDTAHNSALRNTLADIIDRQRVELERGSADLSGALTRALALGLLGLVGSLISTAIFGLGLVRSITQPIRRIVTTAQRLGGGDFSTRVPEGGVGDLRQLSRSLNQMAESLQRSRTELGEQHAELAASREEADRANLAKSEFLSRMSHELRTPLNAILGFAQLLELDNLSDRQRDNVAHIVAGGRHLLDLINEVLEISRIEAGSMNPAIEPVHGPTVIREALELVRPLADQRGISVAAETDGFARVWIAADQQRLKQVLLNLLANAVKYNRDAGAVTVRLTASDSRVRIAVTDTGLGIPQDQISKLFIPFERLGAEATGVEGTGLGLSLALRTAEAMGGTISVESQAWIGSTFSVDMPLAETAAAGIPEPAAVPQLAVAEAQSLEPGDRTVLYIEDDAANAALMSQLFAEDPRLHLMTTMQGTVGLELARRHRPNLILLDVNLPDIDGPEVIQRLHEDPVTRAIPVIVVSADATEEQRARLMALGAARYLTKPLQLNSVLTAIWEVLESPVTLLRPGERKTG
jgi:signal transduction histidine kinase/ActR/RegA family two-component response regulator